MKRQTVNRILCFLFLLASCQEEEKLGRKFPDVFTHQTMEITEAGALFSAEIKSGELNDITDHGFVWGETTGLELETSYSISLGNPTGKTFSSDIRTTLVAQRTYYVRAFVKAFGKTVYGNEVSFKSLGSEGPVATRLQPNKGAIGDTIVLNGRNFIENVDLLFLRIDDRDISASIIDATSTTITFIIPDWIPLNPDPSPVTLTIEGNITSPLPLTLDVEGSMPKITSVFPDKIKSCDTVAIVGKHLTSSFQESYIYIFRDQFIAIDAQVIDTRQDTLFCIIRTLPAGPLELSVFNGSYLSEGFPVAKDPPEIVSVSPLVYKPGDIITIKVKNFPECEETVYASSFIGNNSLPVVSRTKDEVKVRVDYCWGEFQIRLQTSATPWTTELVTPAIRTIEPEILSVTPAHAALGEEVVIRGKNFVNAWVDFLEIYSWSETEIRGTLIETQVPQSGIIDVVLHSCDHTAVLSNGFQYDPPQILDFNPKVITSPTQVITITGKNFSKDFRYNSVQVGSYTNQNVPAFDNVIAVPASVLIPDPSVDVNFSTPVIVANGTTMSTTSTVDLVVNYQTAWTKLKNFNFAYISYAASFSIDDKGYFVGGMLGANYVNWLFEYDPGTDSWTSKAAYPGQGGAYLSGVSAGGKAYVGMGENARREWWEYDPATNVWTQKANHPGTYSYYRVVFGLNGKVYAGGGLVDEANPNATELWEYDPATDMWSRKKDLPYMANSGLAAFAYKGKGYVYTTDYAGQFTECQYDPVTDNWTATPVATGNEYPGPKAMIFDNYVILGGGPSIFSNTNLFHRIVPGTGVLTPVAYAGPPRAAYIGFSIGNYGYIGLGSYGVGRIDIWKFDPDKFVP